MMADQQELQRLLALQHNCTRGGQVLETVLEMAVRRGADLVLIQEQRGEKEMDSTRSDSSSTLIKGEQDVAAKCWVAVNWASRYQVTEPKEMTWECGNYIQVVEVVPPGFFFLFIHYSCATYLDHDEGRSPYVQSISPPQTVQGGTVQASLCSPPRPAPCESRRAPRKIQRKEQRKAMTVPYSASADAMNGGVGRNSWYFPPASPSSSVSGSSALHSAFSSTHSRSSHSNASLSAPSSTAGTFFCWSEVWRT